MMSNGYVFSAAGGGLGFDFPKKKPRMPHKISV
jgi:hypothetical protein